MINFTKKKIIITVASVGLTAFTAIGATAPPSSIPDELSKRLEWAQTQRQLVDAATQPVNEAGKLWDEALVLRDEGMENQARELAREGFRLAQEAIPNARRAQEQFIRVLDSVHSDLHGGSVEGDKRFEERRKIFQDATAELKARHRDALDANDDFEAMRAELQLQQLLLKTRGVELFADELGGGDNGPSYADIVKQAILSAELDLLELYVAEVKLGIVLPAIGSNLITQGGSGVALDIDIERWMSSDRRDQGPSLEDRRGRLPRSLRQQSDQLLNERE